MAIMEEQPVVVEEEGAVATVTVNRPGALNALNSDVLATLLTTFEDLRKNESLQVVVIKGAGSKAFVAGADISSMHNLGARAVADYVSWVSVQ